MKIGRIMNRMIKHSDVTRVRQALRNMFAMLLLGLVILAGCQGQNILEVVFPQESEGENISPATEEATADVAATEEATPSPPEIFDLIMWVPPQFDPNGDSESAKLLNSQLKDFLRENPQVNLEVRVKAASGPGSILDTLSNAVGVAPEAVPSLILLSREDLIQAVNKKLVYPFEDAAIIDESDWYEFSQEMGIMQGAAYGLPFVSNIPGLIYRGEQTIGAALEWEEIGRNFDQLIIPAGDPDAELTSSLYLSAGGVLLDQQGMATLDIITIAEVLEIFADLQGEGILLPASTEFQTDEQTWQYFIENDIEAAISSSNRVISSELDLNLAMLPLFKGTSYTPANGWLWCLTDPSEFNRKAAADLAEYLVLADFLDDWAPVSGYLPVRPSSLSGYSNVDFRETVSGMLLSARLQPKTQEAQRVYAEIRTAVIEVITDQSTPQEAAERALERLEVVETQ